MMTGWPLSHRGHAEAIQGNFKVLDSAVVLNTGKDFVKNDSNTAGLN